MQNKSLLDVLINNNVIKRGQFTLRSGEISPIYIDCRSLISDPSLLRAVSVALWNKIKPVKPNLLCGVPYTALPMATTISLEQNLPMLICRKEIKNYGTKKQVEGIFQVGQNCLMIEDVVTTGSSVLHVIEVLKNHGLHVTDIVALVDREQGGKETIKAAGCQLHSVYTLNEILHASFYSNKKI
ncbi:orotate phosphoribosyltransferase [Rickettsiella grylli]|uniref:Orotate phosphoribosyltransferase n=1 Tax=Rickettsiella grylli TaxID=59196 RepID=A8PMV8_9COXI|nr:orotate phosphoribosyltransferase [Rickettsiella grylli]EDP46408.1 orotate phosphoribosyltransferase [Rickettsiella grylli]